MYLGGQAVGGATVDVLYGKVNPSGHLAETFPLKLQDNPSYLYYVGSSVPGKDGHRTAMVQVMAVVSVCDKT